MSWEGKRIVLCGGPHDGIELVIDEKCNRLTFPRYNAERGDFSQYIYENTGQLTHDYLEIWK